MVSEIKKIINSSIDVKNSLLNDELTLKYQ